MEEAERVSALQALGYEISGFELRLAAAEESGQEPMVIARIRKGLEAAQGQQALLLAGDGEVAGVSAAEAVAEETPAAQEEESPVVEEEKADAATDGDPPEKDAASDPPAASKKLTPPRKLAAK